MRATLLEYLACPSCGGDLTVESSDGKQLTTVEESAEDIESATLRCSSGGHRYPVVRGIPRMNVAMDAMEDVARTFGYEWKSHHAGIFEQETLFGRTLKQDWELFVEGTGFDEPKLRGAAVLDAGCGSGRFTRLIADHGAGTVVGVDINEAIDDAASRYEGGGNVHFVQGNIASLPFKPGAFDLVWCNGVIHHTPDAAGCHRSLARLVKPGGTLYVWVYAARFSPFALARSALEPVGLRRLSQDAVLRLSKVMSWVSLPLLAAYRMAKSIPGLRPGTARERLNIRRRGISELYLTWFDVLSPRYRTTHKEDEVIGWFEQAGFEEIVAIEEPKVGVRGIAPVRHAAGDRERHEAATYAGNGAARDTAPPDVDSPPSLPSFFPHARVRGEEGREFPLYPTGIPERFGRAIHQLAVRENARSTIETGFGLGMSSVFLCSAVARSGDPDARHVAMDPCEKENWDNAGLNAVRMAGLEQYLEFHERDSQCVLPELLSAGRRFDLALVDGDHRFETIFTDLYYLDRLVRPGGIVVVDDFWMRPVRQAVSYFVTNMGWTRVPADALLSGGEDNGRIRAREMYDVINPRMIALRRPVSAPQRRWDHFVPFAWKAGPWLWRPGRVIEGSRRMAHAVRGGAGGLGTPSGQPG